MGEAELFSGGCYNGAALQRQSATHDNSVVSTFPYGQAGTALLINPTTFCS
jgi:hypothetical protein